MKQLELTPPLLILTMGYPGAGKTFFARQFAEEYSLPRISEERIRSELFEQPAFNAEEANIINRITQHMLEETMKSQHAIICDGTFATLKSRQAVYELARKNGYRTLTVWIQTDANTAAQRASHRDKRNPDNKYSFALDNSTFNQIKSRLQRPTEKEVAVVVSGKHAFKSQYMTVLRKITALYSEELPRRTSTPLVPRTPQARPIREVRRIIQ